MSRESRTERILDQVIPVLADNPARTMREIAELSGIGRATLNRHFHTREDLIAAISRRVLEEADTLIAACQLEQGSAQEAMGRLVAASIEMSDRYLVLTHELFPTFSAPAYQERLGRPILALAERGQREGTFDPSVSPRWIILTMANLVQAAIQEVRAGDLARNQAPVLVMNTLLRGIGMEG